MWTGNVTWSNEVVKIINNANGPAIWGVNNGGGNRVRGYGFGNSSGVYGWGESEPGIVGRSVNGNGMEGCADAVDKGGVHGETSSPYGGHGVYGIATNTSASSYSNGVYGLTYSPNGAGGRFYNNRGDLAL